SPRGPSGIGSSIREASLSVIITSGAKVSLARPAASRGMVPMPLARISPLSRQASAAATISSSARVKSFAKLLMPVSSHNRRRQTADMFGAADAGQVFLFGTAHDLVHVCFPAVLLLGCLPIPLEVLHVPAVVRCAGGRVGAIGRVHHAGHVAALEGID